MSPDFGLLSTTRYDPAFLGLEWNTQANGGTPSSYFLLQYQYERLRKAAEEHGWTDVGGLTLEVMESVCDDAVRRARTDRSDQQQTFRIRVLLSEGVNLTASASPMAPLTSPDPFFVSLKTRFDDGELESFAPVLDVYLDTEPTPSSIFTRTKTTYRPQYSAARDRAGLPPLPTPVAKDVLLYNTSEELTETSIRNIAFIRRSPPLWVTPRAETGCLPGVVRRWLLEQRRIVEATDGELSRDNLSDGEIVLTFNGVEGCRLGRIALK